MFTVFWQKIDQTVRSLIPFLTTLLFVLMGVMPWPMPYFGTITPVFAVMAIYYWAVHRPDLMRPIGVFAIGLLYDALTDLPLGLSAFIFVAMHELALSQRRFFVGHSFLMLWAGFILMFVGTIGTEWLILGLWRWQLAPFHPVLLQTLLTIALFPIPAWLLIVIQRAFLSQGGR